MDFTLSTEHREIRALADDIFSTTLTTQRRQQLAADGRDFDAELWRECAAAGLLSLTLPDSLGGAALGLADACAVLIETGRHTAPIPVASHLASVTTLARFGAPEQSHHWLGHHSQRPTVFTAAIVEQLGAFRARPLTVATGWQSGYRLTGTKTLVPAGTTADVLLVPAQTDSGPAVFIVTSDDAGVTLREQRVAGGYRLAELTLSGVELAADRMVGPPDGAAAALLADLSVFAVCAQQFGVTSEAITRTADYAKTRRQFDRPIGSFQAVSHRLADGYIDALGQELTLWRAAWRLDAGLPAAAALATAKFWAAEAGHRVAHSAIHLHGGVGVDLTGDIHRYYSMAKYLEFTYGAANFHAGQLGTMMSRPDFFETA
jgi:alkylation response protein AidB-like acyl-CoA dehydrogenase